MPVHKQKMRTYRIFWVVLNDILYLSIWAIIDVCSSIVSWKPREYCGANWSELKRKRKETWSVLLWSSVQIFQLKSQLCVRQRERSQLLKPQTRSTKSKRVNLCSPHPRDLKCVKFETSGKWSNRATESWKAHLDHFASISISAPVGKNASVFFCRNINALRNSQARTLIGVGDFILKQRIISESHKIQVGNACRR